MSHSSDKRATCFFIIYVISLHQRAGAEIDWLDVIIRVLRSLIDTLPSIEIWYALLMILSRMASDNASELIFCRHPSFMYCEQKIVEDTSERASTISITSLASFLSNFVSSHSSRISSFGFIYCSKTLRNQLSSRAIFNSSSNSGTLTYFTDKRWRHAAIPDASAKFQHN